MKLKAGDLIQLVVKVDDEPYHSWRKGTILVFDDAEDVGGGVIYYHAHRRGRKSDNVALLRKWFVCLTSDKRERTGKLVLKSPRTKRK